MPALNSGKNYIGHTFGRYTVLSEEKPRYTVTKQGYNQRHRIVKCQCSCGEIKLVRLPTLVRGGSKSCGCLDRELTAIRSTKHGHSARGKWTGEYRAWVNMTERCKRTTLPNFHRYGGRGIRVCKRWKDFRNFLADMGLKPSDKHSLDRKKNNKGYTPSNCRWATREEQSANTSQNKWIRFNGEKLHLSAWARRYNITPLNRIERFTNICQRGITCIMIWRIRG